MLRFALILHQVVGSCCVYLYQTREKYTQDLKACKNKQGSCRRGSRLSAVQTCHWSFTGKASLFGCAAHGKSALNRRQQHLLFDCTFWMCLLISVWRWSLRTQEEDRDSTTDYQLVKNIAMIDKRASEAKQNNYKLCTSKTSSDSSYCSTDEGNKIPTQMEHQSSIQFLIAIKCPPVRS